jgi:tetratricopeptide (TPR) repeat protein
LSFYGSRMKGRYLLVALCFCTCFGLGSCASQEQKKSINKTNEGVKALRAKQYDEAISKLDEATKAYSDNHTAWYNLGLAYDGKKKYDDAAKAYERAVALSGKDAMYHMQHGIALYKSVIEDAKKRQATADGKDPSEINVDNLDLKGSNFEPAMTELKAAVGLNKDLYRAYYYMGRIDRHNDDSAAAAQDFTDAIKANPRYGEPYVALGELYRRWGYIDEAIKVLTQAKANLPGDPERAHALFALGMAYYMKKQYPESVTEFGGALQEDKNLHLALFQKGMAEVKLQDWPSAKKDLEDYQKNAKDEYTKGVAQMALLDIMAAQNDQENQGPPVPQ